MDTHERTDAPRALTAAEFFELGLDGYSMSAAAHATRVAYSTIHAAAHHKRGVSTRTAEALQEWSRAAIATHGVYISAARTLGLTEFTASDFRVTGTEGR